MTFVTASCGGSGGRTGTGFAGGAVCAHAASAQSRTEPQTSQREVGVGLMGMKRTKPSAELFQQDSP